MTEYIHRRIEKRKAEAVVPTKPEFFKSVEALTQETKANLEDAKIELAQRRELTAFLDEQLEREPSQAVSYTDIYFINREAIQRLEEAMKQLEDDLVVIRSQLE